MMSRNSIHPVDIYVGNKLRKQRLSKGLSQDELGKKVKITFQQIQKYERGQNRVSSSKLFEFAQILGVNIEYFFRGFVVSEENISNDNLNEELSTLSSEFSRIRQPLIRKSILELARVIAEDHSCQNTD